MVRQGVTLLVPDRDQRVTGWDDPIAHLSPGSSLGGAVRARRIHIRVKPGRYVLIGRLYVPSDRTPPKTGRPKGTGRKKEDKDNTYKAMFPGHPFRSKHWLT